MSILIKNTSVEDLQRAMLLFRGHEIIELSDHGDLIEKPILIRGLSKPKLKVLMSWQFQKNRMIAVAAQATILMMIFAACHLTFRICAEVFVLRQ